MTQAAAGHLTERSSHGRGTRRPRRAFSLMELLVVIALVGIFAALTYTSLARILPATKLRSKATEVSSLFQRARLGAIKAGVDVSVEVETNSGSDTTQFLVANVLNPDGTYQLRTTADGATYRVSIGTVELGSPDRPANAYLGGATGGDAKSAEANSFAGSKLIYKPNGTAANQGALRISIGKGAQQNTIEVAVLSLGGQPVLRKFIKTDDRPSGFPSDQEFFEATHYGTKWDWTWY